MHAVTDVLPVEFLERHDRCNDAHAVGILVGDADDRDASNFEFPQAEIALGIGIELFDERKELDVVHDRLIGVGRRASGVGRSGLTVSVGASEGAGVVS